MRNLRKIDVLVAEHVMGLMPKRFQSIVEGQDDIILLSGGEQIPLYSSDIAAAWEVMEKMEGGAQVRKGPFGWHAYMTPELKIGDWNGATTLTDPQSTAPLAICLTVLAAKGVSVK